MSPNRLAIVTEARKWLGARWQHQACLPYIATDCGQILIAIYNACGLIEKPAVGYYPADWSQHRDEEWYMKLLLQYGHEVEYPCAGDVALFKVGKTFSHGGIVTEWPKIIHADICEGVIQADAQRGKLSKLDVRFFSFFAE